VRAQRQALRADVAQPGQRRREGLQLAQLPFGGAVDDLRRARDLDVDLDARFVDQFELGRPAARRCGGLAHRAHLAGDAAAQRVAERLAEWRGARR
jgi:hypothetical protein